MDVNSTSFPRQRFDLVVNVGAAHHIAYIDRVFRALCELLPDDGWFVSFDYVGPHRNQYATATWEAVWELNSRLPESLRQDLRYPHLPTMLHDDPTEAIHSELVLSTFHRYFDVRECVLLGGALAYPLITHNDRLFASSDARLRDLWVDRILAADEAYLAINEETSLFAYFAGQPDKVVLARTDELEAWARSEEEREFAAMKIGGQYYPHTAFQTEYLARSELEVRHHELAGRVQELDTQLSAFQQRLAVKLSSRISQNRHAARLLQHPLTQRVLKSLRARLKG